MSRDTERIEETGTETSWTEVKKTSLDRKSPNKLSPTKTEKKTEKRGQIKKRIYSKLDPIFCHYRTGGHWKRNWRNDGTK